MYNKLNNLKKEVENLNNYYIREKSKKDLLEKQLKDKKEILDKLDEEIDLLDKVTILFQTTSDFARKQAKSQIESIVTKCLQFIFESDIKFVIELEELRNTANANFYVISKDGEGNEIKTKPELSRGGGVVDIVSLALRIAFLEINKPRIEGPLILDEPAKHVSDEYIFNVGEFLKETSEMFGRQIIIVTHNEHLAALGDVSYNVRLENGNSYISVLESQ